MKEANILAVKQLFLGSDTGELLPQTSLNWTFCDLLKEAEIAGAWRDDSSVRRNKTPRRLAESHSTVITPSKGWQCSKGSHLLLPGQYISVIVNVENAKQKEDPKPEMAMDWGGSQPSGHWGWLSHPTRERVRWAKGYQNNVTSWGSGDTVFATALVLKV